MKIRSGFVSNSSSSSFIIEITKTKKCKHCGHEPLDLAKTLKEDRFSEDSASLYPIDQKKYLAERVNDYGEDELKDPKSYYNRLKKAFAKATGKIYELSIPYGDYSTLQLIKGLSNVKILEDLN